MAISVYITVELDRFILLVVNLLLVYSSIFRFGVAHVLYFGSLISWTGSTRGALTCRGYRFRKRVTLWPRCENLVLEMAFIFRLRLLVGFHIERRK